MNLLINSVRVLCRPRGVLNPTLEHCISPTITGIQCRFKGKSRLKAPPTPKEKDRKSFHKKKGEEEVVDAVATQILPTDDVWSRKYFKVPSFTFIECINRHREYASPEMTDNLEGIVVLDAELDLTTKKKTKFLGVPSGTILLPHNFDNFFPGRVVAISKSEEDHAKAEAAGAVFSGGLNIIRKLEKGDIKGEDYDHIVLHPNLLVEAAVIRKLNKELFPTKKNGKLGENIEWMVKLFADGKDYQGTKVSDAVGKVSFPIGKLNMTDEQLWENAKATLAAINEQKQAAAGPNYFAKLSIRCPPSKEVFVVADAAIIPRDDVRRGRRRVEEEEEEEQEEASPLDNVAAV